MVQVTSCEGSPIVATTDGRSDPIVFAPGSHGDNRLYVYRGDTGEALTVPQPLRGTTKFRTLIAADGRLYVTGAGKVYAFTF